MPRHLRPPSGADIYMFCLPSTLPLGESDTDFCNVEIRTFDPDTNPDPLPCSSSQVFIAHSGKLGTLTGGLLHVPDERDDLTPTKVKQMRADEVEERVAKKRTGARHLH